MKKKIAKVMPAGFGHLMLEFEDGVKRMVHRGDHEKHDPEAPPDGHEHVTSGVQTGALRKPRHRGASYRRSAQGATALER
jgi:hypothetical protein